MKFYDNLDKIKKERLIESVVLLRTSSIINIQLNVLLSFAEKGAKELLKIVSGGMKALSKVGEDLKGKEGFLKEIGQTISMLSKSSEELDKTQIDWSSQFIKKFETEKALVEKWDVPDLVKSFKLECGKMLYKKDIDISKVSDDELWKGTVKAISDAYNIDTSFTSVGESEKKIFSEFISEIIKMSQKTIESVSIKDEKKLSELIENEYSKLENDYKDAILDSFSLDSFTYENLKSKFKDIKPEGKGISAKGFGVYLGSGLILKSYASMSGIAFPFVEYGFMSPFLAIILLPLPVIGLLMAGGVFAWMEFKGSKDLNKRILSYVIIPIWSEMNKK